LLHFGSPGRAPRARSDLTLEPWRPPLVGPPMQKRAILFDIDGTLVDSNDAHVEAWHRALAVEGYAFGRTEIHAQMGKGGDNLVPSLLPDVSVEMQERLAEAEGEIYRREFMPQIEPFEGASEVLKRLAERGHTLVLASSASRAEVDHYVDLLDADGLITGTTSKDDVRHSKPCPDIFAAALDLTGGPAAAAIVVGDTPYDVVAARRAGIDAIAVLSGGFPRDELEACGPVAIYDSVVELDRQYAQSPIAAEWAIDEATADIC
jgi:HAD superfamily hydrolase (TIGR01549 family)